MPELELVCRLEAAAARGWPATIERPAPGGWMLRATPGLDRARSNHALSPCRELEPAEIVPSVARVLEFAREHSIRPGIQVSPLELHGALLGELDSRGWTAQWPTVVLSSAITAACAGYHPLAAERVLTDHATSEWLAAWARCEPGRDVAAHAATVFARLRGRATFARIADRAVAIVAESDRLAGLFCLAIDPAHRRAGLASALVRALLADSAAQRAFLQVEERNLAARSMYARLGFTETYRYCHRTAA